ncbi:30S ribosomal protein S1 [Candidatus Saganbacteria bacterium]|nr:30S ribosomal protein S1 [Candidatus Saganbacteria bacterium]
MTHEEYSGTSFEKSKGEDEFLAVESLIQETLAESKLLEKSEPAPPPPPIAAPTVKPAPQPAAEKAAVPAAAANAYEATFKEYRAGDIVKGKVIKIDPGAVLVDINYKADGLILPEELSDRPFSNPEEIVKIGEMINVYIIRIENKEGYVVLSKKQADYEGSWHLAQEALKKRTLLEGKVIQAVKGGLVVDCQGLRGFVPASQVQKSGQESLEIFNGQTIAVKIIEVNRRQGKIIMSHKMAAGEQEKHQSSKIFDELEVGQIRRGKVSSLKTFGAFVDIGGAEGLIHLSELSWKRVRHPSELLKIGQEIDVFVLGVDRINRKVALGLKELQTDPWEQASEYFKPGQVIKAKIVRFAKFGAFAEIDHDLEGLIHISELSKTPVERPEDAGIKIGDVVDVKILRVQQAEQRIGLSIKEAQKLKEKEELKESQPPTDIPQKVTIGDIITQKEKNRAEREEIEAEEIEEAAKEEQPT